MTEENFEPSMRGEAKAGDHPLVSVAVVTYNQKDFLRECIESILSQDYPNVEIVVADDGSTDGTQDLLREYEGSGRGRFVLRLSAQNKGVTANQNLAQSACSGKYISWMAGDDLMLPGKLRKQAEFLERHPDHAICYHDLDIFDSDSGRTIKKYSDVDRPRSGGVRTLIRYGCFNGAVSNMVRAECQPTPAFDARVPVASDWLYWVECLWAGGKIGYIDEVLGRHRRHDKNVTPANVRTPSLRLIQDHLFSCEIISSRGPGFHADVNVHRAYLYRELRWIDGGRNYRSYLRVSLSYHFTWKVFAAVIVDLLFGYKR